VSRAALVCDVRRRGAVRILDGGRCQSPLRNGLQVQQMMEATLASARTRREVVIRDYCKGDIG